MPRSRKNRYEQLARQTAAKYGVPVRLFLSLIDHESSWQPRVVSGAGAVGLTQLMPGTARGLKVDPWDPKSNLDGGARYLHGQFKRFGNWKDALRAYNVGPGGAKDPNAGLEYANSVLAGRNAAKFLEAPSAASPYPQIKAPIGSFSTTSGSKSMADMFALLFPEDKEMISFARQMQPPASGPTKPLDPYEVQVGPGTSLPSTYNGKVYVPASAWSGTHVTDNLDWNNGRQTAVDIMKAAGTPVGAPEAGRVVRHGGAQGGQSLYFLSDTGHLYWMGHIENAAAVGTRVQRGQAIAVVSADHADPHLHIDRYYGQNPGQFY